jgi:hypothetical protein
MRGFQGKRACMPHDNGPLPSTGQSQQATMNFNSAFFAISDDNIETKVS